MRGERTWNDPLHRKKIRKNWRRRIQYAQRHPIRVWEIRELRAHPEVFDALATLREAT